MTLDAPRPALSRLLTHRAVGDGLRLTDADVARSPQLRAMAVEVAGDVARLLDRPGEQVRNSFMRSLATRVAAGGELTDAQVRGLWNTVLGSCSRTRARLYESPQVRRYWRHPGNPTGFGGTEPTDCVVCGKPLKSAGELARGVGETCWKRVLSS